MDLPQYSPQKVQQSKGRVEPSLTSSTVRVPSRRNLRRTCPQQLEPQQMGEVDKGPQPEARAKVLGEVEELGK